MIDLKNQRVYVHRGPAAGAYANRTILARGDQLSAQFAPTVSFSVDEVLG